MAAGLPKWGGRGRFIKLVILWIWVASIVCLAVVWSLLGGLVYGYGQGVVDSEVVRALENADEARVIIAIKDPVPLDAPLEQRRKAVAEAQKEILSALSLSDFRTQWQYDVVPALAGTIAKSGLAKLTSHPLIVSIYPDHEAFLIPTEISPNQAAASAVNPSPNRFDLPIQPQMAEGVPLVNADDTHNKGITGTGVVVAVIDSGIDFNHPELNDGATIVASKCFVNSTCSPQDINGHGTQVAGIITANGGRLMPNGKTTPKGAAYNAKLVIAKVSETGQPSYESIVISAIDWILGNPSFGVSIMSMSIDLSGGTLYSGECDSYYPSTSAAINQAKAKGITTFAASGNNGSSTKMLAPACFKNAVAVLATYDEDYYAGRNYPGCESSPSTIKADQVICYSNTNQYTDVAAPGDWTITTNLMSVTSNPDLGPGVIETGGTSMATPYAAAVAALMKQANPSLTPDQIVSILKSTGIPVTDSKNNLTFPRVDAFSAIFVEVGEVSVNSNWMTVSLTKKFTNSVVVAKPMGYASSALAVVRTRNVTSTSFQIRIQPWDYLGGTHDYERVGYIVMEKGHYQLKGKGGATFEVEAGTTSTNCTHTCWKTVSFAPAFSTTPVVISSVTSYNETQAVVTRNKGVTSSKFYVQMQEQEKNTQSHVTETISYIAWTPTPSASDSKGFYIDGKAFKAGTTGAYVKDSWYTITFNPDPDSPFTRTPALIADMQTKNGTDPCNLRWSNKSSTSVKVRVAEEQSWDSETTHENAENVGFFAFACASCSTSFSPSFAFSEPESKMESHGEGLVVESIKSFPNPLKGASVVTFEIQGQGISEIKVEVYDLAGRRVWDSGFVLGQSLQWSAMSARGEAVANGVYLYVVRARGLNKEVASSKVQKLIVLR